VSWNWLLPKSQRSSSVNVTHIDYRMNITVWLLDGTFFSTLWCCEWCLSTWTTTGETINLEKHMMWVPWNA
jgi:hypothetical protein